MKCITLFIVALVVSPGIALAQKEWTIEKYGEYTLGKPIKATYDCNRFKIKLDAQGRRVCSFVPSSEQMLFGRKVEHINLVLSYEGKLIEIAFILHGTDIDSHLETVNVLEFEYGKFILDKNNRSKPISRRVLDGNNSYLMTYVPVYYNEDIEDFSLERVLGARVYSIYRVTREK